MTPWYHNPWQQWVCYTYYYVFSGWKPHYIQFHGQQVVSNILFLFCNQPLDAMLCMTTDSETPMFLIIHSSSKYDLNKQELKVNISPFSLLGSLLIFIAIIHRLWVTFSIVWQNFFDFLVCYVCMQVRNVIPHEILIGQLDLPISKYVHYWVHSAKSLYLLVISQSYAPCLNMNSSNSWKLYEWHLLLWMW